MIEQFSQDKRRALGAFAIQRDRLYAGVTAIVLAVLLWSLFGGYG